MLRKMQLLFLLVLAVGASIASAQTRQTRQCLGDNGQTYTTYLSSCPQSMPEIRKKIQSCTLKDGSKAFGDKCPQGAAAKETLDSQSLSSRDAGLKNQYQHDENRMIQQAQFDRMRARAEQQNDLYMDDRNREAMLMKQRQNERAYRQDR